MAGRKILGASGLERMRDSYFKNEGAFTHATLDAALPRAKIKAAESYGKYRMMDLYPDTYATMTTVPADLDVSKLRVVDGLFQGCAALQSIEGLDISSAVSANDIFNGCTALKSVKGVNAPKCESWERAFMDCTSLSEIEEWDTSVITDFHRMFEGCTALPETFPWTLDVSNARQKNTKYTCRIFAQSSVRNVTLKQDWRLNINIKDYPFQYIVGKYFEEYKRHNAIDTTAASIDISIQIGNDTYTARLPEPADWVKESYFDSYRKNWDLWFSKHISGDSIALYSKDETAYTYTDASGTTQNGVRYTPKTYAEDPTNYQDVITYEEKINRDTSYVNFYWSGEGKSTSIPAKSIYFKKKITHILKPAINITWA